MSLRHLHLQEGEPNKYKEEQHATGCIVSPKHSHLEPNSRTSDGAIFGDGAFKEMVKVK